MTNALNFELANRQQLFEIEIGFLMNFNELRAVKTQSRRALKGISSEAAKQRIETKFANINGKTSKGSVPDELFQNRTSRWNRCLISWSTVKKNQITFEQLDSFEGGVVVEIVNDDFFNKSNQNDPLFSKLISRIGSNNNVSAILTFRNADKKASPVDARLAFQKFILQVPDWQSHLLKQERTNANGDSVGVGNEKWSGKYFVKIAGGDQNSITPQEGSRLALFNPASEYLDKEAALDLELVMLYFALHAVPSISATTQDLADKDDALKSLRSALKTRIYDTGDLLMYCDSHESLVMDGTVLMDPIQLTPIYVDQFGIDGLTPDSIDFTHNQAVEKDLFIWDSNQSKVLSPARANNVFWSTHLSNMMQQHFTLEEFYSFQQEIVDRMLAMQKRKNQILGLPEVQ